MLKQKPKPLMYLQNIDSFADQAANLLDEDNSNRRMLRCMADAVRYAVEHELTDRQRTCFTLFVYDGLKKCDIAAQLGLHPATVTRCIQAATRRVGHYARYSAMPFLGRPLDN